MKLRYLILFFGLIYSFYGNTQITSSATFSEATSYSVKDKIFVFCTDDENGGSLTAIDSTNVGGKVFEWYKFNPVDTSFTISLGAGIVNGTASSSNISGLNTGGYKVVIKDIGLTQVYVAWIYNATERTVELELDPNNDCDFLGLRTSPYLQTTQSFNTNLVYTDTIDSLSYTLKNKIALYKWESDTEPAVLSYNSPYTTMPELPTENTIFYVTVTDRFGCIEENEINYTAIETKALFSWETFDYKTEDLISNGNHLSNISEQAPLIVQFTNESKNGYEYMWSFGDSTRSDDLDTIITQDFMIKPLHTYYYTNRDQSGKTYKMKFQSESEAGCLDSVFLEINVKPVKIEFPNVFTPNGDLSNDVFIVKEGFESIRNFKITIFNRVGQVVHEYDGDIRDWKGWKGKVKNSSVDAPEGNYFFVVDIKGWDKKNYDNNNISKLTGSEGTETGTTGDSSSGAPTVEFGLIRLYR